jgi:hypothetical protein
MIKNSLIVLMFISSGVCAQTDFDKCVNLLRRSESMIYKQDSLIGLLKEDLRLSDLYNTVIRKQNENSEITINFLNIELRKEKRQKKFWQVVGISCIAACLTTTVLYLAK